MNRSEAFAVLLLLFVVGAGWWFLRGGTSEEPVTEVPAPVAAVPAAPDPEVVALPALADSSGLVRELAQGFGMIGATADALLGQEDLVRRFVRIVDAVANGSSPAGELDMLAPEEPFTVIETGDEIFVDPVSFSRYDAVGEAIARIDADAAVAAYRNIEPLADEVYSEIVGEARAFRPVLMRALSALLAVPVVTNPTELTDAINRYRYADRALESLSLPQKHLLRMGPTNVGRIQAQLRQIARLLN